MRGALRLGLPLDHVRAAWACVGLAFTAYALTLAPDLTFYDSPELALVAHQLGLGHPIGQPLHTWLGFLAARLPGIPPLTGLAALSALFGALALLPAWSIAERLSGEARPWVLGVVLVAAALHPIGWEPSSRVEVYTLAAFLGLWATARAQGESPRLGPIGFALGLAACVNAVIAVAFGLALVPRLISLGRAAGPGRAPLRQLLAWIVGGLGGLLPYLHIPLVASERSRFVWGAPEDVDSLRAYLTGADYAHNAGIDGETFLAHVVALAEQGFAEGSLPIVLLGLGAHLVLGRRIRGARWTVFVVGALCVAFVARNLLFHPDVPDYRGYLFGPWHLIAAGVAAAATRLVSRGARFRAYGALVAALPVLATALSPAHLLERRDAPALGRALVRGALAEAPPGAILVVEADHWVAPLLWAQEAEESRLDVVILAHGLASSSWYWEHLFTRHPELERIALRGPGGRDGRIRRLLDANPSRAVLTESWGLAQAIGREPCAVGWLVWTAPSCEGASPSEATAAAAAAWTRRGEAREVVARVGLTRGEALWRLGRGADAHAALLAGVPSSVPAVGLPVRVTPLGGSLPEWSRHAAVHDPARNLFVAALLLHAAGLTSESRALLREAAAEGLPEALAR